MKNVIEKKNTPKSNRREKINKNKHRKRLVLCEESIYRHVVLLKINWTIRLTTKKKCLSVYWTTQLNTKIWNWVRVILSCFNDTRNTFALMIEYINCIHAPNIIKTSIHHRWENTQNAVFVSVILLYFWRAHTSLYSRVWSTDEPMLWQMETCSAQNFHQHTDEKLFIASRFARKQFFIANSLSFRVEAIERVGIFLHFPQRLLFFFFCTVSCWKQNLTFFTFKFLHFRLGFITQNRMTRANWKKVEIKMTRNLIWTNEKLN